MFLVRVILTVFVAIGLDTWYIWHKKRKELAFIWAATTFPKYWKKSTSFYERKKFNYKSLKPQKVLLVTGSKMCGPIMNCFTMMLQSAHSYIDTAICNYDKPVQTLCCFVICSVKYVTLKKYLLHLSQIFLYLNLKLYLALVQIRK